MSRGPENQSLDDKTSLLTQGFHSLDLVKRVPDQTTLENTTAENSAALQNQTLLALLSPEDSSFDLTFEQERVKGLQNYKSLLECECSPPLDRNAVANCRTELAKSILFSAMEITFQKKDTSLRIGVIGSGALLNELFLLATLLSHEIKNIQFDFVDIIYSEPTETSVVKIKDRAVLPNDLFKLSTEFLTISHYGLGLNIFSNKAQSESEPCLTMTKTVCDFAEKTKKNSAQKPSGFLGVGFFSSIEEYAHAFPTMENKPDIIYDIDFSSPDGQTLESAAAPIIENAVDGTKWFSTFRRDKNTAILKLEKEDGQWIPKL
ncbi:MAG: hypothetical protein NTU49_10800 [Gammaproteobacteria bacterium]|nr:hypothetical protein [Gammaproteobacteria bacterium]